MGRSMAEKIAIELMADIGALKNLESCKQVAG